MKPIKEIYYGYINGDIWHTYNTQSLLLARSIYHVFARSDSSESPTPILFQAGRDK
jgi:hypothetical protein